MSVDPGAWVREPDIDMARQVEIETARLEVETRLKETFDEWFAKRSLESVTTRRRGIRKKRDRIERIQIKYQTDPEVAGLEADAPAESMSTAAEVSEENSASGTPNGLE